MENAMDPAEYHLLTFEEAYSFLNDIHDGLPEAILRELNGGIVLLPDVVLSPHRRADDLYILGMYHYEPYGLGRYITINYGSFAKIHRHSTKTKQKAALQDVLYHELVHHLESLAGVRDLEEKDKEDIARYLQTHQDGEA